MARETQTRPEIATILFTDLVGSTELMQRLGDREAQRIFLAHHNFLRDTVVASGGDPVDWTGDGVMATFSSVSDAVGCAVAVQRTSPLESAGEELGVRVGLNVGEVLRQRFGSGYFGTAVVIASRLCDAAEAGQILCSSTVAALLSGTRAFVLKDLGKRPLKGIEGQVGVSEVTYQERVTASTSLKHLHDLLRMSPDIVVATNEVAQVSFFSDGAEKALGWKRDEIMGHHVLELYANPKEAFWLMAAMRDPGRDGAGRAANLRTVFICKSRKEVPAMISGSLLLDDDGNEIGTLGIAKPLAAALPGA